MKNVRFKVRARKELHEALFGAAIAGFFLFGLAYVAWLWGEYGERLSLTQAVQAAFTTCYAGFVSIVLIRVAGEYAYERGKVAMHYYARLAKCPAAVRGRR